MNKRVHNEVCKMCKHSGHIARFCPQQWCEAYGAPGHVKRDCPHQHVLRELVLWFPLGVEVHAGVIEYPMHDVPGIGPNLQLLTSVNEIKRGGHTFSSASNALRMDYSGAGTVAIAIQDADSETETLIQVRRIYAHGIEHANIQVSAKYVVERGQLIERVDRLASGTQWQATPNADTHVLLHLADCVASLETNGTRYYMEWFRDISAATGSTR